MTSPSPLPSPLPLVQLDAHTLDSAQSCPRRVLLEADWQVRRIRPKTLFDFCLRDAIRAISSGTPARDASSDAQTRFLTAAAEPGLDVFGGANPYLLAKDYCAMLATIPEALSRLTLLTMYTRRPEPIADDVTWRYSSWSDQSGALHRWLTVERWDEDALARELHAWRTVADMAFAGVPLTLHVIEIGRVRASRRSSDWARAWLNSGMPNTKPHFRGRAGAVLRGWKPHYFVDARVDAVSWVDQMEREGALAGLIQHVPVAELSTDAAEDIRAQVIREGVRLGMMLGLRGSAAPWHSYPLSRGACDGLSPCPWQGACYTPNARTVKLDELGLYVRRTEPRLAPSLPSLSPMRPQHQSPAPVARS